MGFIEQTVKESGDVAEATTKSAIRAVSIMAIPLLELVILTGVVILIIDLPARFIKRGE
jgi:hypothetical protein